jgi:hypothetical protein
MSGGKTGILNPGDPEPGSKSIRGKPIVNTIPFGGKEIDFKLVRSNREKTVGIDFDSEGQLTILAPRTLEDARIEEIIKKKARWIMEKKRQKWKV